MDSEYFMCQNYAFGTSDVLTAQFEHASAKLAESWKEKQLDLKQAYYNYVSAVTFEERVEYVAETQRICVNQLAVEEHFSISKILNVIQQCEFSRFFSSVHHIPSDHLITMMKLLAQHTS